MDNTQKPGANYALNGQIMLCSVIILFVVVFVVACFHSSVRLCFHRNHPRRRTRRLFSQNNNISPTAINNVVSQNRGLDLSILKTLPSFLYSTSAAHDPLLECAVCLSEFEDGERGRVLPNCKHAFHIECIDTWFESNSNCPLCRRLVRFDVPAPTAPEVVITVSEEPAGSSARFAVEECGRSRAVDLVGMGMEERVRNFGWAKSEDGDDEIGSLKRIWSI